MTSTSPRRSPLVVSVVPMDRRIWSGKWVYARGKEEESHATYSVRCLDKKERSLQNIEDAIRCFFCCQSIDLEILMLISPVSPGFHRDMRTSSMDVCRKRKEH